MGWYVPELRPTTFGARSPPTLWGMRGTGLEVQIRRTSLKTRARSVLRKYVLRPCSSGTEIHVIPKIIGGASPNPHFSKPRARSGPYLSQICTCPHL